jgi:cytidylate kinase
MVGRDIGTVVLPEADLKIYLDATVEERARRRYKELIARGEQVDYDDILKALRHRDQIDSTRDVAPLRAADDAIVLDSDDWDADQVLNEVMKLLYEDEIEK